MVATVGRRFASLFGLRLALRSSPGRFDSPRTRVLLLRFLFACCVCVCCFAAVRVLFSLLCVLIRFLFAVTALFIAVCYFCAFSSLFAVSVLSVCGPLVAVCGPLWCLLYLVAVCSVLRCRLLSSRRRWYIRRLSFRVPGIRCTSLFVGHTARSVGICARSFSVLNAPSLWKRCVAVLSVLLKHPL